MRVLITGAGGFIGSYLVKQELGRGHKVTAVDVNLSRLRGIDQDGNLHLIEADFRDRNALDSCLPNHDICFHLASAHLETGVGEDFFWKVNVDGTAEFVERCYQAGIERFIHCSSVGVFGEVTQPLTDEEGECNPEIPYEKSKLAGEQAVIEFSNRTGYPVVAIRPSWVYGPGCPRTMKLVRTIEKGRFFYVGSGQNLRHPIYIDDMVTGFELAAYHPNASGEVFIMAGPRAVTLQELVEGIAACSGVSAPSLRLPLPLVDAGCYMLEASFGVIGRQAPFTRRSLKFFTGSSSFSTRKAKEVLGFQPRVDLQEGLERMYEKMTNNHS